MGTARRPIGIVSVAFGRVGVREASARAAGLGFAHVDCSVDAVAALDDAELATLPVPVGDRLSGLEILPGCTSMVHRARDETSFDRAVAKLRTVPDARIEAGPGSVAGSVAGAEALCAAVPGLRLTVDTGHVACWGEDPVPLLHLADVVQLRQAAAGRPQLWPDEGGDVDFAAVLAELDRLDFHGLVSVEYFDLPDLGWPLEDPVGHAVALAAHVRALMD